MDVNITTMIEPQVGDLVTIEWKSETIDTYIIHRGTNQEGIRIVYLVSLNGFDRVYYILNHRTANDLIDSLRKSGDIVRLKLTSKDHYSINVEPKRKGA